MHRETVETPYGRAVVVSLADDEVATALAALPAEERERAATLSPIRMREWVAGRTALHVAADDLTTPFLSSPRGAPIVPGRVGSVSHKGNVAAAIVGDAVRDRWIGIDIERAGAPKVDIARRILTEREQQALPDRERAVTLRFSIKEAIYKAVDPIVNRYVGFQEVELELDHADRPEHLTHGVWHSTCRVTSELPADIEACWQEHVIAGAPFWLTFARASQSHRGWVRNS